MTADEILKHGVVAWHDKKTDSVEFLKDPAVMVFMLTEIAAQLAEMNETLRKDK